MKSHWFIAKLFFEWIPYPLPCYIRQEGEFKIIVPELHPELVFLNVPGAFLYLQCNGKRTVKEVLQLFMVEYLRSDRDNVSYEIVKLLRQMERFSMLYLLSPWDKCKLR